MGKQITNKIRHVFAPSSVFLPENRSSFATIYATIYLPAPEGASFGRVSPSRRWTPAAIGLLFFEWKAFLISREGTRR